MLTARFTDGEVRGEANAVVPWWSFGKTVLAAAALRLVAEGRLALDVPLAGYGFTLRALLQHRAGMPDYGALPMYHAAVARKDMPWTMTEMLANVAPLPAPRGWRYSNVGYFRLREVLEHAEGADLETILRRLVPVKLARTPDDLAACAWGNPHAYHPGWVYHGLLQGTPTAAVTFLRDLLCGNILPADLRAEMMQPFDLGESFPHRPWRSTGYGLGLMIGDMANAGRALGHSGAGPGSVAAVYYFPDRDVAFAAFAEGDDEGVAEWAVARAI